MEARPAQQVSASTQSGQKGNPGELHKRIQELQIWVQTLNGGTSAQVDPQNWENPLPGVRAEQQSLKMNQDELTRAHEGFRDIIRGLQST